MYLSLADGNDMWLLNVVVSELLLSFTMFAVLMVKLKEGYRKSDKTLSKETISSL